MNTVKITYYGMDGTGKNVTEAKRDAGKKIERALSGSYSPVTVEHRGHVVLLWREPDGWHYRLITTIRDGKPIIYEGRERHYGTTGGFPDNSDGGYAEAREAAEYHLAQSAFLPDEDTTDAPGMIQDKKRRADFQDWARWQVRYRDATRNGLSDNDARDYAGRNPARPDLANLILL